MAEKAIRLDIVTPERIIFSQDVDFIVVPGTLGQLGVLPDHIALITSLEIGMMKAVTGTEELKMAISGGFFEVKQNKAVILADTAEKASDIDVARAQQAKERAEKRLAAKADDVDLLRAELALRRATARLKVADKL